MKQAQEYTGGKRSSKNIVFISHRPKLAWERDLEIILTTATKASGKCSVT